MAKKIVLVSSKMNLKIRKYYLNLHLQDMPNKILEDHWLFLKM